MADAFSSDVKTENGVITDTFSASEEGVRAVRQGTPLSASGQKIERVPWHPILAKALESGSNYYKLASTDRCIRRVDVPVQGGGTAPFHCSMPCVSLAGSLRCPEHDKESFQPIQTPHGTKPRSFNSDSIKLSGDKPSGTDKEYFEKAKAAVLRVVRQDAQPVQQEGQKVPVQQEGQKIPETGTSSNLNVSFSLAELSSGQVAQVILERIVAALDELPARNVREMKAVVELQDRLKRSLGRKGKEDPKI